MERDYQKAEEITKLTGLEAKHFADLIRAAQLVYDPSMGVAGRKVLVEWESFNISDAVADNLSELGKKYQYASPHVPMEFVWEELNAETRSWLIDFKDSLWELEEVLAPLDED